MWLLSMAFAQEPATGTLRVEVSSDESSWETSWAMEMWRRSVRRLEREWRRSVRRSEEPVAEPELPEPPKELPIIRVELTLTGPAGERTCVTDTHGVCVFADLPPGAYRVVAERAEFCSVNLENIQVNAGRTTLQSLLMRPGGVEDIIITGTYGLAPRATVASR